MPITIAGSCPRCGQPLPAHGSGGLCAFCIGQNLFTSAPKQEEALQAALTMDGYALGPEIGCGAMGRIFRARHVTLGREVALKLIHGGAWAGEQELARFRSEAAFVACLDHPNIVPIFEVGEAEGMLFFSMKLVEGGSLAGRMSEFARPREAAGQRRIAELMIKIARGVQHAHERGVLHRDLKPGNILLDDNGEPLVADFGLARQLDAVPGSITLGAALGTPAYMAPEQAKGGATTTAADVHALGAVLYELLTGKPPYQAESSSATLALVLTGDPPARVRSLAPTTQSDLATICERCLEREPGDRYTSARALAEDLERWLAGEPVRARPVGRLERLAKWARRQPALAAMSVIALLFAGAGAVLGSKVIVEGRRAERALADLKETGPALRQLAESEAGFQRFDSALEKLGAALALDPGHTPSYWRRAWLLLGREDFAGAAAAIQLAAARDPAHREWAQILPTVKQLAAAPESERWTAERADAIHRHLQSVGAESVILALTTRLKLAAEDKVNLVRARLDAWLGKNRGVVETMGAGLIGVRDLGRDIESLEPLSGLPINMLTIDESKVADLAPLLGMPLLSLRMNRTKVTSLEPLRGMPLQELHASHCEVANWTPLRGKPLRVFHAPSTKLSDLSFLEGAPLEEVGLGFDPVLDISSLRGAPLKNLDLGHTNVATLEPLRGRPLERLDVRGTVISDLEPLRGAPLQFFNVALTQVTDLSPITSAPINELITDGSLVVDFTPLLAVRSLQRLRVGIDRRSLDPLRRHSALRSISCGNTTAPFQPVERFWASYDAAVKSEQAATAYKLGRLIAERSKRLADGTLELDCADQQLHDLTPLKGLNLSILYADKNPITDLTPLIGMPLRFLGLRGTMVSDLSPLRGMPLVEIHLYGSPVADLSPLRGMPLERLFCDGIPVRDLSPLLDLPKLRQTNFPRAARNIEILRSLPNLQYMGWEKEWSGHPDTGRPARTAAEFWARWDSLRVH